jgi:2-oxo-3-hexenedioate decarboxylase
MGRWRIEGEHRMRADFRQILALAVTVAVIGVLGGSSAPAADADHGADLAKPWCATCHVIDPGQKQASADAPRLPRSQTSGFSRRRRSPSSCSTRSEAAGIAAYIDFAAQIKACKGAPAGGQSPRKRNAVKGRMDQGEDTNTLEAIAAEAFGALCNVSQIPPFSARPGGLNLAQAYRVTPRVRRMYEAQGARVAGRKIGFTNPAIWEQYGVYAPIWGYVFDNSVQELATVEALSLAPFSEPRIEPEIVFGLGAPPSAEMDERALSDCVAWVALGFEIVQSIFPGWKFQASDTVAANGVHGALLIGPRHPFAPRAAEWRQTLPAFEIELSCNGALADCGHGSNVLGGPLSALRHLVGLLESDSFNPPLAAGEIVSTGTLTKAMSVASGESWAATPSGIGLDPVRLRFPRGPGSRLNNF